MSTWHIRMRRRELLLLLGGAMTATPGLRAQQKAMPAIGYLNTIEPIAALLEEFRAGLAEQATKRVGMSPSNTGGLRAALTVCLGWRPSWFTTGWM